MKKSIIIGLVFCTCLLVAQDIAGTYRATGQRVEYQFFTRPNTHLSSGNADGSTSLTICDSYGLGVCQELANIPVGYNFVDNIVGPIGLAEMDALQYFLYVTLNEDGSGSIDNSQVLASITDGCETAIALQPLDDELNYSSNLEAGLTVQSTMVTGHPNVSPYAGQTSGSWSISGSSFFSFFPATPTPVTAEFQLYGDDFAACYPACVAAGYATGAGVDVDGDGAVTVLDDHAYCAFQSSAAGGCAEYVMGFPGFPHPGTTAGYLVGDPASSFAPSNQYFGVVPDLHVEWHYIDGPVAETGLGDVVGEDEDGDGTDYDNILGYPSMEATFMNPACGFNYPILGDVTAIFAGSGCVDESAGGVDTPAGVDQANSFYVMDAAFGPWGNFLTWNYAMYSMTGDASFLVDDSGADVNPADITFLDLNGDGVPETPYNPNGGRIVMNFDPTCIPVLTSISVLGELTNVGGCQDQGDVNSDGFVDVLDVVAVVGSILGNSELDGGCGDMNDDGAVDVLDVVAMVSVILGGRDEAEATSVTFTRSDNLMTMTADGAVGAVQMTLSHGSDFRIQLTEDAYVADYNTDGGTTKLIVVNPNGEIFSSTGDYSVESFIAATNEGYIKSSMSAPDAIALEKAYPNPFNPSTSFDLNIGQAGDVSVMVYNVAGQLVDVIHQGSMDAGVYNMTWNGQALSSGMYIIKASNAGVTTSQKVMLIK